MKQSQAVILYNAPIARDVFKMELETDIAPEAKAGQFIQVGVPGLFMKRPISVSWTDGNTLRIVYKKMGKGTDLLAEMKPGQTLDIFGPLGTGFPIAANQEEIVIMGGGVGTPPMLKTAQAYLEKGVKVNVILGFNSAPEVFYVDEFEQLGITPVVCTMDGTAGVKGTVLDGAREKGIDCPYVLACGPLPMLRAISDKYTQGYISLESRMGCGFGVCNACVVYDKNGLGLRVCKNGPVFPIGKVVL